MLYPNFNENLPNLEQSNIPEDIKKTEPQLQYAPDYSMSNDKFKLSFSDNAISFGNVNQYQLWGSYSPFIIDSLSKIFSLLGNLKVERIGVRYISVFDSIIDPGEIIQNLPSLKLANFSENFHEFKTLLTKDDISLFVRLFSKAEITKNQKSKIGTVIDIDSFSELKTDNLEIIIGKIDLLHTEQKNTFFSLLKPSFLDSLNPKY